MSIQFVRGFDGKFHCPAHGCDQSCTLKFNLKKHYNRFHSTKTRTIKTGRAAKADRISGLRATDEAFEMQRSHDVNHKVGHLRDHDEKNARYRKKRRLEEDKAQIDSEHNDYCEHCDIGGDLILCDYCTLAYHTHCVFPILYTVPKGTWMCPECTNDDTVTASPSSSSSSTSTSSSSTSTSSTAKVPIYVSNGANRTATGRSLIDGNRRRDSILRTQGRDLKFRLRSQRFNMQRAWVYSTFGSQTISINTFNQFRKALGLCRVAEIDMERRQRVHIRWANVMHSDNMHVRRMIQQKMRVKFSEMNPDWKETYEFEKSLRGSGEPGKGWRYFMCSVERIEVTTANPNGKPRIVVDYALGNLETDSIEQWDDLNKRGEVLLQLFRDDPDVPSYCKVGVRRRRSAPIDVQAFDPQFMRVYRWWDEEINAIDLILLDPELGNKLLCVQGDIIDRCEETSTETKDSACYEKDINARQDIKLVQYHKNKQALLISNKVRDEWTHDDCDHSRNVVNNYPYKQILKMSLSLSSKSEKLQRLEAKLKPPAALADDQKHAQRDHNTFITSSYGDSAGAMVTSSQVVCHGRLALMPGQIPEAIKNNPEELRKLTKDTYFTTACDLLAQAPNTTAQVGAALSCRVFKQLFEFPKKGAILGSLSIEVGKIKSWKAMQNHVPKHGDPVKDFDTVTTPLMDNALLKMQEEIDYWKKFCFTTGDGKELLGLINQGQGEYPGT